MKTYAAIYNNNEIRENSSSGGIFSALADSFDVCFLQRQNVGCCKMLCM